MTSRMEKYQDQLKDYEKRIVQFFVKTGQVKSASEKFSTIMGYFLTRRELTQEQLLELTGYSAGTISNALNQLLVVNIVNCRTIPGSRKKLYQIVQPLEMMGAVAPLMKDYLNRRRRFLKRITRVTEQIAQKYKQIIVQGGGDKLNPEISEMIQKFQHFIKNFKYTIPIMEQISEIFTEEFGKLGTE